MVILRRYTSNQSPSHRLSHQLNAFAFKTFENFIVIYAITTRLLNNRLITNYPKVVIQQLIAIEYFVVLLPNC